MSGGLTLPQQMARMDPERMRRYRENLDFYNGVQWQGSPRRRERRLTFNYAMSFVNKVTSYLMAGSALSVEPVDKSAEAGERARRAEEALGRVAEENSLEQLDFDTELDAAILGDGCYKVTWDGAEQRMRVSAPDVQGIHAWWVGDDFSRVWRVASGYRLAWEEAQTLYGVKPPGAFREPGRPWLWRRGPPRVSSYGWTTPWCRRGPTPMASYPLCSFPTYGSPSSSGESAIYHPLWSHAASLTGPCPSFP